MLPLKETGVQGTLISYHCESIIISEIAVRKSGWLRRKFFT